MGRIEKISISLPEEMLKSVNEAVDSGQYASTSDVIRDALRGWQMREPLRKAEIEGLRKAWEEGLASGPARPVDFEDVKQRGRERLARSQQAQGG